MNEARKELEAMVRSGYNFVQALAYVAQKHGVDKTKLKEAFRSTRDDINSIINKSGE